MDPDLKIIFKGIPPSKKNGKRVMRCGGRTVVLSSVNHDAWHTENMWLLKKVRSKFEKISLIKCIFYPGDEIRRDCTNVAESIMDILVDAGIIKDDNWFVLSNIQLIFGGVDKSNPRVEVELTT